MTGKELIKWIKENHAENKEVIVEHRDSGGTYGTAEYLDERYRPVLVECGDSLNDVIYTIKFKTNKANAILL